MKKFALVIAAAILLVKFEVIDNPFQKQVMIPDHADTKVVLYATSWCGYCRATRELLGQLGVPYKELDIETSQQGKQEYKELKGTGVPLMLINGEIVRGYNPNKIKELVRNI